MLAHWHTMQTRRVVVTGASSGIGAATVARLTASGASVLAVARRETHLHRLAEQTGCDVCAGDITHPADIHRITRAAGDCDALVNNAGGAIGLDPIDTGDLTDWQTMFDVNVLGTLRITQALLPALRRAPLADVLTVTSTAAFGTYEGGGGYCAAKHAERVFVDTLRLELCGEPVRVTNVAPGMVRTDEFSLNRFRGDATAADAVYAGVAEPLVADDIADCIDWMLSRPAHVNIDTMVVRPVAQAANHKVVRTSGT